MNSWAELESSRKLSNSVKSISAPVVNANWAWRGSKKNRPRFCSTILSGYAARRRSVKSRKPGAVHSNCERLSLPRPVNELGAAVS